MPQTKKYAIRCSSEDEARECNQQKYNYYYKGIYTRFLCNEYNIPSISYKEAVEMGLLGEKTNDDINYMQSEVTPIVPSQITTSPCPNCGVVYQMGDDNKFHIIKGPNKNSGKSYNMIGKIMEEIDNRYNDSMYGDDLDDYDNGYRAGLIIAKQILTKHLSSK